MIVSKRLRSRRPYRHLIQSVLDADRLNFKSDLDRAAHGICADRNERLAETGRMREGGRVSCHVGT